MLVAVSNRYAHTSPAGAAGRGCCEPTQVIVFGDVAALGQQLLLLRLLLRRHGYPAPHPNAPTSQTPVHLLRNWPLCLHIQSARLPGSKFAGTHRSTRRREPSQLRQEVLSIQQTASLRRETLSQKEFRKRCTGSNSKADRGLRELGERGKGGGARSAIPTQISCLGIHIPATETGHRAHRRIVHVRNSTGIASIQLSQRTWHIKASRLWRTTPPRPWRQLPPPAPPAPSAAAS